MDTRTYTISIIGSKAEKVHSNVVVKEEGTMACMWRLTRWSSNMNISFKVGDGWAATFPVALQMVITANEADLRTVGTNKKLVVKLGKGLQWEWEDLPMSTISTVAAPKVSGDADAEATAAALLGS